MVVQANPKSVFSSWVNEFNRAYRDNVEVLAVLLYVCVNCDLVVVLNLSFRTIDVGFPQSHKALYGCPQEYERRFETWVENLNFIEAYNSDDKTHWVRIQVWQKCFLGIFFV